MSSQSTQTQTVATVGGKFHQRNAADPSDALQCDCPIHKGRSRDPFTAPLGKRFASDLTVTEISRDEAEKLYQQHHGYMASVPQTNIVHHGIQYQQNMMAGITYRYALMRHKKIHLCTNGNPLPRPRTEQEVRDKLPVELHSTALDTLNLDRVSENEVAETRVVDGDHFIEAARICVGVSMPNLASASLAHSQEKFVVDDDCEGQTDIEYLITFVRSDFDGAMIRSLRDKGWTCVGWTSPSQASNRENKDIRNHYKWCFICPVENIVNQRSIREWV